MKAHTEQTQATMTADLSLQFLKEGNNRFLNNLRANRNLIEQVEDTRTGQFPFATVLGCIDSRVSNELIFDQGIGDIFSVRIAGNFVNRDILGSMEFACKISGTKLIVVLGHTECGAVKGAYDDVKLGNLTAMLENIKPAVNAVINPKDLSLRNSSNIDFVNSVGEKNVQLTIDKIFAESEILSELHKNGEVKIIGAMYDIHTGEVKFYE